MKRISVPSAVALVVLFSAAGFLAGVYVAPPALKETVFAQRNISALLPKNGYSTANVSIDGNTIVLQSGCRIITFDVTDDQALSINFGLQQRVFSRPLTHDIIKDIFEHYEISVESVSIDSFEEEIYRARIFLRQKEKVLDIDTRPSDAIALAARFGMKILIKDSILESRGRNAC